MARRNSEDFDHTIKLGDPRIIIPLQEYGQRTSLAKTSYRGICNKDPGDGEVEIRDRRGFNHAWRLRRASNDGKGGGNGGSRLRRVLAVAGSESHSQRSGTEVSSNDVWARRYHAYLLEAINEERDEREIVANKDGGALNAGMCDSTNTEQVSRNAPTVMLPLNDVRTEALMMEEGVWLMLLVKLQKSTRHAFSWSRQRATHNWH
ncbi:hypothetical protein Syun_025534 [Stephania yunnanensis]|uniref:Uncharacterized protein n=1 Tax=Stephania yunnanensis TaxID=152371 RepID=A0AAP0HV69_9MAGN